MDDKRMSDYHFKKEGRYCTFYNFERDSKNPYLMGMMEFFNFTEWNRSGFIFMDTGFIRRKKELVNFGD